MLNLEQYKRSFSSDDKLNWVTVVPPVVFPIFFIDNAVIES